MTESSRADGVIITYIFIYVGVTLGFNQSLYVISESDGSVGVCVDLEGQLERAVLAEVFILESSASGNNASAVIDITLYLSNLFLCSR